MEAPGSVQHFLSRNVVIVGMAGAGKSNLANKLLDHPTCDAFEEGDGTPGVTTQTQRVAWRDLVVIDTPAIPDADPSKTLTNFDLVVEAIRREGSISALIFLVRQEGAVSPAQFRDYAVLLKQFNHLPCSKLMVCRQPAVSRRNKKAEEEKRYSGAQYVEHVLQDSGLSMPLVLLTDGYGSESFKQVEEIVSFVRRSDRVRVSPSLRTSDEYRQFVSRLSNPASRLDALKQEVKELETSLWHRSLWMAAQVVPLAYMSVASMGAGCLWTGPYVKREQAAFAELRSELVDKKEEIEFGLIDEEELRGAQGILSYLNYIFTSS